MILLSKRLVKLESYTLKCKTVNSFFAKYPRDKKKYKNKYKIHYTTCLSEICSLKKEEFW